MRVVEDGKDPDAAANDKGEPDMYHSAKGMTHLKVNAKDDLCVMY